MNSIHVPRQVRRHSKGSTTLRAFVLSSCHNESPEILNSHSGPVIQREADITCHALPSLRGGIEAKNDSLSSGSPLLYEICVPDKRGPGSGRGSPSSAIDEFTPAGLCASHRTTGKSDALQVRIAVPVYLEKRGWVSFRRAQEVTLEKNKSTARSNVSQERKSTGASLRTHTEESQHP